MDAELNDDNNYNDDNKLIRDCLEERWALGKKEEWPLWKILWEFRRVLLCNPEVTHDDVFDIVMEYAEEIGVDVEECEKELENAFTNAKAPDVYTAAQLRAKKAGSWSPPGKHLDKTKFALQIIREYALLVEPYLFFIDSKRLATMTDLTVDKAKAIVRRVRNRKWAVTVHEYRPHKKCKHMRWVLDMDPNREMIDTLPLWAKDDVDEDDASVYNNTSEDGDDTDPEF